MNSMTLEAFYAECARRFGPNALDWKLVCPACKTEQSIADFKAAGISIDTVNRCFGYSCIGRFTHEKGCGWTLGGLLHIHTLEVEMPSGHKRPTFEIATPADTVPPTLEATPS